MNTDHKRQNELAHGFNEELTIILNSAKLVEKLLGPDHPASSAVIEMRHSAVRCARLARKFIMAA